MISAKRFQDILKLEQLLDIVKEFKEKTYDDITDYYHNATAYYDRNEDSSVKDLYKKDNTYKRLNTILFRANSQFLEDIAKRRLYRLPEFQHLKEDIEKKAEDPATYFRYMLHTSIEYRDLEKDKIREHILQEPSVIKRSKYLKSNMLTDEEKMRLINHASDYYQDNDNRYSGYAYSQIKNLFLTIYKNTEGALKKFAVSNMVSLIRNLPLTEPILLNNQTGILNEPEIVDAMSLRFENSFKEIREEGEEAVSLTNSGALPYGPRDEFELENMTNLLPGLKRVAAEGYILSLELYLQNFKKALSYFKDAGSISKVEPIHQMVFSSIVNFSRYFKKFFSKKYHLEELSSGQNAGDKYLTLSLEFFQLAIPLLSLEVKTPSKGEQGWMYPKKLQMAYINNLVAEALIKFYSLNLHKIYPDYAKSISYLIKENFEPELEDSHISHWGYFKGHIKKKAYEVLDEFYYGNSEYEDRGFYDFDNSDINEFLRFLSIYLPGTGNIHSFEEEYYDKVNIQAIILGWMVWGVLNYKDYGYENVQEVFGEPFEVLSSKVGFDIGYNFRNKNNNSKMSAELIGTLVSRQVADQDLGEPDPILTDSEEEYRETAGFDNPYAEFEDEDEEVEEEELLEEEDFENEQEVFEPTEEESFEFDTDTVPDYSEEDSEEASGSVAEEEDPEENLNKFEKLNLLSKIANID